MSAPQTIASTGPVISQVHKSLGIAEREDIGSIRSVLYHCHEWLRARDSTHRFSFRTIDDDRANFQATGILPACVERYYEEVVKPSLESATT